ncbi:zf-DHHC-domain-containing protein [Cristinia sonorae]|uniref:Palmitoyltransferase n=1 Tax=Cristinia sonorae TaxID=1940300 RepID=A0A8K0UVU8_9AGAR|nr:zf-DHHC-domain-containing protein [Cristinia sonorae]
MSRERPPLISLGDLPPPPPPSYAAAHDDEEEKDSPPKRWYHYLPLVVVIILLLAPHPSLLIVLVRYHLLLLQAPGWFAVHFAFTYTLSFLVFSSLIVILARDPGPVPSSHAPDGAADDDLDITQALLSGHDDDMTSPGKWCRKCWAPKPPRTHHCSSCGRCILKMDHHCAWLGNVCLGHRTYTSFLHFLTCTVALSAYIAVINIRAVYYAFTNPLSIDESTPIHCISLSFASIVITMVIGPFLLYHCYLISTNQTTLESLSPFLLLRQIPPLPEHPADGRKLSYPPLEHELSYNQRRLVREAHGQIRQYDIGLRGNWSQVIGWDRPWGWVHRILIGGSGKGDGLSFPRNPRADEMLSRLATELVDVDKDR